jgi:putative transposase
MTQTITIREGRANVFVAVEHANSEVVGIHASRSANRFEALEPVRQGVHQCFGAIAPGVARGLKGRLHHIRQGKLVSTGQCTYGSTLASVV